MGWRTRSGFAKTARRDRRPEWRDEKSAKLAGQRVQMAGDSSRPGGQRPVQQRVLGKAAHPHRVFDG
jgi:hypothetical protein